VKGRDGQDLELTAVFESVDDAVDGGLLELELLCNFMIRDVRVRKE